MENRFHAHNGWFFQRNDDGGVKITIEGTSEGSRSVEMAHIVLTASEWASVLQHVARERTHDDATRFHQGVPAQEAAADEKKLAPRTHSKK